MKLGDLGRDTITGFTGVITAKVEYLNGCIQYSLTPPLDKDGKLQEAQYFDHQRLETVPNSSPFKSSDTGGPQRDTPPTSYRA